MCALTDEPCPYTKNWLEDGSLKLKHVANYVLIEYIYIYIYIYVCVVFDWINYFITKFLGFLSQLI